MKKSFLHTFVVLSVFAIFVFGNTGIVLGQDASFDMYNPNSGAFNKVTGVDDKGKTTLDGSGKKSTGFFDCVENPISCALGTGSAFFLQVVSLVLRLSGGIFDTIVNYTILDQSFFKGIESSILSAWKIVRDVANIVIVFSLLYLGIKTILNGNGFAETKVLISIIIAAILINFSLVITQTVFNVSNIVGAQIGEQITFSSPTSPSVPSGTNVGVKSISEGLVSMIRPEKMTDFLLDFGKSEWEDLWSKLQTALFTGTAMLLLVVVFFGASILLMYRFLVFILLMITSPIGITSSFVPWFAKMGEGWWKSLKTQAIVLPAFLLTLYISILFVAPISTNLNASALSVDTARGFSRSITEEAAKGLVTFIFNYFLIIGFLLLPLIVPGKIGAAGAEMMTGAANWTTKKIRALPKGSMRFAGTTVGRGTAAGSAKLGRAVFGGGASKFLKSDKAKNLKRLAQDPNSGWRGRAARASLSSIEGLKNKSFDIRNTKTGGSLGIGKGIETYNAAVDSKKKKIKEKEEKEKKLFGFDKPELNDDQKLEAKMKLAEAQADRDMTGDIVQMKKEELKAAKIRKASQEELNKITKEIVDAEKELEKREQNVGELMDTGKSQYVKLVEQRQSRKIGLQKYSITRAAAVSGYKKDIEKEWKEKGKYKVTNKKKQTTSESKKTPEKTKPIANPPPLPPTSGGPATGAGDPWADKHTS